MPFVSGKLGITTLGVIVGMPSPSSGLGKRLIVLALLTGTWLFLRQQVQKPSAVEPLAAGVTSAPIQLAGLPDFLEIGVANQLLVLNVLAQNDRQWQPRLAVNHQGLQEYTYRQRPGAPELSLQDIQALLRSPPDYASDVASIKNLLAALDRYGVTVVIAEPNRLGASGEWNPRRGEMRISHSVVARGTQAFRRVLNHEAIHTAQSCAGGSIRSFPKPLGLSRRIDRQALRHLDGKVYVGLSSIGRRLEEEAYANQDDPEIGALLLRVHCRR